jgi:hypothetical protein
MESLVTIKARQIVTSGKSNRNERQERELWARMIWKVLSSNWPRSSRMCRIVSDVVKKRP